MQGEGGGREGGREGGRRGVKRSYQPRLPDCISMRETESEGGREGGRERGREGGDNIMKAKGGLSRVTLLPPSLPPSPSFPM